MKVKKTKRFLSVLLALMIIISAVPLSGINAFAAESKDYEYQVFEDSVAQADEPAITQDAAYEDDIQENAAHDAFIESGDYRYIVLEDGTAAITKYIGDAENLVIPSEIDGYNVTGIKEYAFEYCDSVSISIPESITSIERYVFEYCLNLENITVDSNNPAYSDVNGVLFNKAQTELVRYPEAKKDTDYTIPYGVTTIKTYAFYLCTSLVKLTIPNSVKTLEGGAFYECTALTDINIPNSVTSIGDWAFYSCDSLTDIAVPNGVTNIGEYTFGGCNSLTNITISNSVTSIGEYAFEYCTSLTNIAIPNSVTNIGSHAFWNCTSLTDITISSSITSIEDSVFEYCSSLASITIPSSVTSIGKSAFQGCTSLTDVVIPNSVTSIGKSAFQACTSLENVTIPGSVTSIELSAFENCKSLTDVTLSQGVTNIGQCAFSGCESLTDIEIPNSVTSMSSDAFDYCNALENIIVNSENTTYSDMDGVLFDKEQTNLVRYPEGRTAANYIIPYGVTTIGNSAFKHCTFLTTVDIPNSVTQMGWHVFQYCASLTSIVIPNSVTTIGASMFQNCTSLTDVTIPDSVTLILDRAFSNCTSLKKIFIPDSVMSLGFMFGKVFDGCDSLTIYGYAGTAAETYANENGFEFIALDKTTDVATGISVAEKELNILPDGSEIKTALLSAEDNRIVFDISLIKDGSEVQPNGEVTVKIPVPERMVGSLLKVYREEADGSLTDMNAYFADGSMIFTTDHFSKYIITAEEIVSTLKGDVNGDGTVDAADAVLVQRYDAGMVTFSDTQLKAADVNSDGTVDAADAVLIMRFDAGLIERL